MIPERRLLWMLLDLLHGSLQVFTQTNALVFVRLIFSHHLVYLRHFQTAFDMVQFDFSLFQLLFLLPDRALVAVNQLLSLGVLLARPGVR